MVFCVCFLRALLDLCLKCILLEGKKKRAATGFSRCIAQTHRAKKQLKKNNVVKMKTKYINWVSFQVLFVPLVGNYFLLITLKLEFQNRYTILANYFLSTFFKKPPTFS